MTAIGASWLGGQAETQGFLMGKLQLLFFCFNQQRKNGGKFDASSWINEKPLKLNDIEKLHLIPAYLNLNLTYAGNSFSK